MGCHPQQTGLEAAAVKLADRGAKEPIRAAAFVIGQGQVGVSDLDRFGRRDRQGHRPIRQTQRAAEVEAFGLTVRRQNHTALQAESAGLHQQTVQLQSAIRQPLPLGLKRHAGAEEFRILRQKNRAGVARKIGRKAAVALGVIGLGDLAGQPGLTIGGQVHRGGKVRQRAFAGNRQAGRRGARHVQQGGGDPSGTFGSVQRQIKHLRRVGKAGRQRHMPLRSAAKPLQVEMRGTLAPGKRQVGGQARLQRLTQELRPQHDLARRDAFDIDGNRQIGQGQRPGLWRGRGRGSVSGGDPLQIDLACRKFVDLDMAGQKGRAAPVQRHVLQGQPDALSIGDGHLLQAGLRGQGTLKPIDRDGSTGARQIVLQPGRQKILVGRRVRHRGQGQQTHGKRQSYPHQNACPKPM